MASGKNSTEKAPQVSVLMSVYNGERFLKRSVESILGQTYTDFEFLILDDGSKDSTWEILVKYAEKDPRILLVRNEVNIGLTKSLNKGLNLARGEYVARHDADDISLPNRLELQIKFMDVHSEVGVVGSALEIIDQDGKTLAEKWPATEHAELKAELLMKNNALLHTSILARTELLNELGGYDESIRYAQDYDLWWRCSQKAKVANLPVILVRWRECPGRISQAYRQEQLQCMFEISYGIISGSLEKGTLDREVYRRFWWAYHGYLDKLEKNDLRDLEPLWSLLSSSGAELKATITGLRNLVYDLIQYRKFGAARCLIKIIGEKLAKSIERKQVLKNLLKALLP